MFPQALCQPLSVGGGLLQAPDMALVLLRWVLVLLDVTGLNL